MNKRRSIEVIKNGCPKKSPYSSAVIKNGRPKKLACSLAVIKNDRPKKLAHFQDQAMIPRTSKKTFKRQILKGHNRNNNILKKKIVEDKEALI